MSKIIWKTTRCGTPAWLVSVRHIQVNGWQVMQAVIGRPARAEQARC